MGEVQKFVIGDTTEDYLDHKDNCLGHLEGDILFYAGVPIATYNYLGSFSFHL